MLLIISVVKPNLQSKSSLHLQSESTPPPCSFLTFFPNGWEFLITFLHTYYTFQSTLDYKFVIQLSPNMNQLCHTKRDHPSNFLHFTRT